jgi:6-phosphogluconolactonase
MKTLQVQRSQIFALAIFLMGYFAPYLAEVSQASTPSAIQFVYIGTHGTPGASPGAPPQTEPPANLGPQGIYAARLDNRTGQLSMIGVTAELQRATWFVVHPSLPVLYSVADSGNGMEANSNIVSFKIDAATGHLQMLNKMDAGGRDATVMGLDGTSKTLLVGNHGSGSLTALPLLPDGSVGPVVSLQQDYGTGPTPRQKTPAAHGVAVDPTHRYVLVADFGADRVFVYHFAGTTRTLSPAEPAYEAFPAGSGPRHVLFHPNGRFVIVDTELTGELSSFAWSEKTGRLDHLQTLSPYPAGYSGDKSAAEIAVSGDGRFVYLSLRDDENKILVYAFDAKRGTMREIQRNSAGGKTPWSFGLDTTGHWMLVTNEASNSVVEFAVDRTSGKLSPTGQAMTIPKPVNVSFFAP